MSDSFRERCEVLESSLGPGFEHYYEDLRMLERLRQAGFQRPVIYDIGASNTVWSVLAHAIFPDACIEMFEPLAEVSDRYAKGKLTHPKVVAFLQTAEQTTHPIALGRRNGTCRFCRMSDESASTSLDGGFASGGAEFISLPMRRLDDYAKEQGLPPPDIIKLDTQGSEIDILHGAGQALSSARAVFVESWTAKGYGKSTPLLLEMAEFLSHSGFFPADFCGEHRTPAGVLNAQDVLFLKGPAPASLVQAEVVSGESAFTRLAGAGFDPSLICVYGYRQENWQSEAASVFPNARISWSEPPQVSRNLDNGQSEPDRVFVFDAVGDQPLLPASFARIITPGSAVIVKIRFGVQDDCRSTGFLAIARQLAERDFHLFDLGLCGRDSDYGFLKWADAIFVSRSNPKSPLHSVWPADVYSEPCLKMFPPSVKNVRMAVSRLKQWLLTNLRRAAGGIGE